MAGFKTCIQCGETKPVESFRQYYGGRKGRYARCLECERINSRCKYLRAKDLLTELEKDELAKIERLYDAQRLTGRKPPGVGRKHGIVDAVDSMLKVYNTNTPVLPTGLAKWLTEPLTDKPEYYDDIYEDLKKRYRPIVRIGADLVPVYDDTYKGVLEQILDRFSSYEDKYYE